jgi:hypothetical protein
MKNSVNQACVILDDPLLKENYGFLNYRKLLSLMDKHNFHTSIAFIPFNYNRTNKSIADLFRERPDRFSLCVHGCDHTKGEFGKINPIYLDNKVKLSTARMVEHEKMTRILFDRVMVFPQGIFSNAALEALKNNNYLAAINTEAMPVDGRISSTFPFFLRYKPEDITDCIPDPIFIVLHHDYFKNGYEKLADFVDELNTRLKNVKWGSVGNIVRSFISTSDVDLYPAAVDVSGLKFHGYKENIKILLRRYASEFRDNYLCKNEFLLNSARNWQSWLS